VWRSGRSLLGGLGRKEKSKTGPSGAWGVCIGIGIAIISPAVRKRYGIPEGAPQRGGAKHFQNLLLAKRLVQAGARCVTLTVSRYPLGRMMKGDYNWDWHFDNFREARLSLPMLDIGITALLDDLEEQGMLDDVAVVVWGEFGRTPRINKNGDGIIGLR